MINKGLIPKGADLSPAFENNGGNPMPFLISNFSKFLSISLRIFKSKNSNIFINNSDSLSELDLSIILILSYSIIFFNLLYPFLYNQLILIKNTSSN